MIDINLKFLKMIINNLELILPHINIDNDLDDFYFLQIIKRRKENPDMTSNSSIVKTYYISSVTYLEKKMPEIIMFCEKSNARACISLNRRSFEKIAFHTLRKVTEQICNKDFYNVKNAYDKACGAYSEESDKKWIIDLDKPLDTTQVLSAINGIILGCQPNPYGETKFITTLPTPNGVHMITKPFNIREFNIRFKEMYPLLEIPEIHKNNPTILYFNKK